eukprot:TRINITY_DN4496_c0_g2_i2.p1 TRINITY_DN4496_c0_g2~~TRINITY_DN4496_c0_g2_i2.p1  ORF type:complete len:320 (-),score=34.64 TRINITY_DN4496_c0_g2_i2:328-1287(-)
MAAESSGQSIRSHCYACEREVHARQLDEELECPECGSSCLERLEEDTAEASRAPALTAPVQLLAPSWLGQRARRQSEGPQLGAFPRPQMLLGGHGSRNRRHQGQIAARPPGRGQHHIGVICNGCHARDFLGTRYRCLRCRDFDLCETCHAQRGELHPSHPFQAIRTPRTADPSLANLMASAASGTVFAIVELGIEDSDAGRSGLDNSLIAWWLADEARLVSVDRVAAEDPGWCCPICALGLEAECDNGWVVQICGGEEQPLDKQEPSDMDVRGLQESAAIAESTEPAGARHVYHEACLRRWLLKRNSCPVCRRSPVVPT